MGIIKLQAEGDTFTATVKDAEVVKGQYGEQVKFTTNTGDILFLPKDSAIRQLERLGLAVADAAGETLTFSRDHNPKKGSAPYWGISVANVREAQPKASPRVSSPYVPPRAGPHIPGLDDDPGPQDPDEPLYREPSPTPREQREAAGGVDFAVITKRQNFLRFYADTYKTLAQSLVTDARVPLTAEAVQAATATCIIQMDRKGLLP